MKASEIVELIKAENPSLMGKISDKKAAALIRNAFNQIGKQIESTDEGVLRVRGLGNFRVKKIVRVKGGKNEVVRRIVFRTRPLQKNTLSAK